MPGNGCGGLRDGEQLSDEKSVSGIFGYQLGASDWRLMLGYPYDFKAFPQTVTVVTIPSTNAEVETAMTSPHWRRLFVSA